MSKLKPLLPRAWFSLPKSEQDAIVRVCNDEYNKKIEEALDAENKMCSTVMLKYSCYILHTVFGFTAEQCEEYVGAMKVSVRDNRRRIRSKKDPLDLSDLLDFMTFPTEFVEKMMEMT